MTTVELVDLLHHAYDGDPWHGPSLRAVLQRCSPARGRDARDPRASLRVGDPAPRHRVDGEVERRLDGRLAGEPDEGDWPGDVEHA